MLPLSPRGGGLKTQNAKANFPSKITLRLKKVCYKVSLYENCQQQSCKAFVRLCIHAKMIGGERLLLCENLADTDPPPGKTPIVNIFSLVAPQP